LRGFRLERNRLNHVGGEQINRVKAGEQAVETPARDKVETPAE
jgi:hypothetical protein